MSKKAVCYNIKVISLIFLFFVALAKNGLTVSYAQEEVFKMVGNLHWLGHASFRLDASKVIYFDPWKIKKDSKKADLIFISHEHFDHYSREDLMNLSTADTVIIATKEVARQLKSVKAFYKELKALSSNESVEIYGIKIKAVPSYNTNKDFHPKNSEKLGYIIEVDGVKIYHAGDTDNIPEMKDFSCDIALLPVSGTYVMTADEAASAALIIKPKIAIPMHYGDIVGTSADAKKFKELLLGKIEVKILPKEN